MHDAAQFFHHDTHVGHITREASGVFRGEQAGDAQVRQSTARSLPWRVQVHTICCG